MKRLPLVISCILGAICIIIFIILFSIPLFIIYLLGGKNVSVIFNDFIDGFNDAIFY